MRRRKTSIAASIVSLALLAAAAVYANRSAPPPQVQGTRTAGEARHDYYVMALSWSPSYCLTRPDDREQCGGRGYGFVLHGLWPQYENGGGPERCGYGHEPDRKTVDKALAFMPSRGLVYHEWRQHGSCSGMEPAAYFDEAGRAWASFDAPAALVAPQRDLRMRADDLRSALRRENPGLRDDAMRLHCRNDRLAEVRICLDHDLQPRSCGKRMRNACPVSREIRIPAVK